MYSEQQSGSESDFSWTILSTEMFVTAKYSVQKQCWLHIIVGKDFEDGRIIMLS